MFHTLTRRSLLAAALCAGTGPAVAQSTGAPRQVAIAISSTSMGFAPLRLAYRAGLFKRHGLDVSIKVMDNGNMTMAALLSRSVDFGTPSLGEALIARSRGQKVVIVANINRGMGNSLILSKKVADSLHVGPDSPLEQRLKALNGLAVAFASATSPTYAAFGGAVAMAGAKVRPVYMGQMGMLPALERGVVDAIVISPPNWVAPVLRGSAYLWVSGSEVPASINTGSTASLQALEDYARGNPDVVAAVKAAMADAVAMIRDHPDDTEKIVAALYPDLDPRGVSLAFRKGIPGWTDTALTPEDVTREVSILRASGQFVPGIEQVSPAALLEFARDP